MTAGLRAFLQGILDYAGLFPPARLELRPALENFVRYRNEAEAWMLGRFVCPAARLIEVPASREAFARTPVPLTVLGRGGNTVREFFDNVRADLADVAECLEALGSGVRIESYEVRLPVGVIDPPRPNQIFAVLGTTAHLIETSSLSGLAPFFECPVLEPSVLAAVTQGFLDDRASAEATRRARCLPPGWKLRCGGTEAAAFPTPRQVALVVGACCASGIPWKGTAGMHRPLRHFDAAVGVEHHGFVNIFAAGILAHAGRIDDRHMEQLLEDKEPANFGFSDTGLRWRDYHASVAEIEAARTRLMTSFGSCSFDEPRDGLRELGWL